MGLRHAVRTCTKPSPLLRGTVFTDRGVYRLGEEVHFKAILRQNTASGVRLLPAGTPVVAHGARRSESPVDERTIKLTAWSSADWTMTLPQDGTLGNYSLRAMLESDRPKPKTPEQDRRRQFEPGEEGGRLRSVPERRPRIISRRRIQAAGLPR